MLDFRFLIMSHHAPQASSSSCVMHNFCVLSVFCLAPFVESYISSYLWIFTESVAVLLLKVLLRHFYTLKVYCNHHQVGNFNFKDLFTFFAKKQAFSHTSHKHEDSGMYLFQMYCFWDLKKWYSFLSNLSTKLTYPLVSLTIPPLFQSSYDVFSPN